MKNKRVKRILLNLLYPVITLSIVISIWAIAAYVTGSEFILPTPVSTFKAMMQLFTYASFHKAFWLTFLRSLASFLMSFVLALVLGILSGISPVFKKLISPLISIFRALPTVAVALLLVIWTNREWAAMIVSMLVIMPTLYAAVYSSVINIDGDLLEMAKVYNVPKKRVLTKLYIPLMMPDILQSAASGISLNLKLIVAAEVIANTASSIGGMMNIANMYLEIPRLLALTVFTIITAVVLETVLKQAIKPFFKWQKSDKKADGRV